MKKNKEKNPWEEFLKERVKVIEWMSKEKKMTDIEISYVLSMNPVQVLMIRTYFSELKES